MNLFFLDIDPKKCAEYHCDKHVVKMIIEIVQMLYAAHHINKSELPPDCYKVHSPNHPTCVWIRQNKNNYIYASTLAVELAKEYTHRYFKIHKSQKHAEWLHQNVPDFKESNYKNQPRLSKNLYFQSLGMTDIPLAMPVDCFLEDTIKSYRKYYLLHKKRFVKWTLRDIPPWFCFINVFLN